MTNLSLEIRTYLSVLLRWSWFILFGAVLAGVASFIYSSQATPRYQASATLMVGQIIRQANPDQQEIVLADRLAGFYLELLRRQPVLSGIKQELSLDLSDDVLSNVLAARVVPSTAFIELMVTDTDPVRVVKLANAFARELIKQSPTASENQSKEQRDFVQKQLEDLQQKIESGRKEQEKLNQALNNSGATAGELEEIRSRLKALQTQSDAWQSNYTNLLRLSTTWSPNSISVLEEARQARPVKRTSLVISIGLASAGGAALALLFALCLEYLDKRVRSSSEIRSRFQLPVLGHIARHKKRRQPADGSMYGNLEANNVQAYENICTNIIFAEVFDHKRKSILITSTQRIAEQAEITHNLALTMLSQEQQVLLVDANTENPELHELLKLQNRPGFHEVFYEDKHPALQQRIIETSVPNLYLMPAGFSNTPPSPVVIMRAGTKQIYDLPNHSIPGTFAIFNCGNILQDKTARLLASNISGTVILCVFNQTQYQELTEAIEIVKRLRGTVIGIITVDRPRRQIKLPFFRQLKPATRKLSARQPASSEFKSFKPVAKTKEVVDYSENYPPETIEDELQFNQINNKPEINLEGAAGRASTFVISKKIEEKNRAVTDYELMRAQPTRTGGTSGHFKVIGSDGLDE